MPPEQFTGFLRGHLGCQGDHSKCMFVKLISLVQDGCAMRLNMYKQTFGKRLRMLLVERGWTNERFAEIIGVSPPMVSRYLSGENMPEASFLFRIADIFDISADWLAGRTDNRDAHRTLQT